MWFEKLARSFFMIFDSAVYWFVEKLYELFIQLSEVGIFNPEQIHAFASRIYFFLGLAMLFKVSISIVNYIMNPDSVKDNKVGAGKLLRNIVIILVGIVTVPYIFDAAYALQRIVLRDNVIPNLILGAKFEDGGIARNAVERAGRNMAFTTYTAFVHLNEDYFSPECYANPFVDGDWNPKCLDDSESEDNPDPSRGKVYLEQQFGVTEKALLMQAYKDGSLDVLRSYVNMTFKDSEEEEQFFFDYMIIITTIAGGFLCYILLTFCFDIAVRSVKLGFLQLIAPIPLISKVDPKKGDEVFNKWVKECISTYLSLFGRLIAIYFAIFIISSLTGAYNIIDEKPVTNVFVSVFIIFGTLLFAKDLPKLIETLTGIKVSDGILSPNKKLRSVPIIGGATAEGLALGGRTIGNIGRGLREGRKTGDLAGSMKKALTTSLNDGKSYLHGMYAAGKQAIGLNDRELDRLEREKAVLMKESQEKNTDIARRTGVADTIKKMEDRAWDQIITGQSKANDASGVNLSTRYRELQARLEEAKASGVASRIELAQANVDNFKQSAINDYMSNIGTGNDLTFDNLYADYEKLCDIAGITQANRTVSGEIHKLFGQTKGEISEANRSLMETNDRIKQLDEEQKRIQEDIKSSKPYYTTKR